ncbi:MAG TPA: putative zinc-binding protein [Verrucomicrobiae bacterium]|nr:putative zinc-binding protein [Verrucomicrobiae bacterium]
MNNDILSSDKAETPGPSPQTPAVVYACSGCSDAGEIADRVARQLTREGAAQMSCLAGIGGRVKSLVVKAEKAERILVVDGCPLNCAAHTLRLAGFEKFEHLELHKIGIRKGACPATDEKISAGVAAAKGILSREQTINEICPEI